MNAIRTGRSAFRAPWAATVIALTACAATAAWWGVRITAPRPAIAPAVQPTLVLPDPAIATPLFGSTGRASQAANDPRLASVRVVGVIVHPSRGAALLAVDGAAPRAYAIGDTVGSSLRLIGLNADSVVFERFGEQIEVPAPRRGAAELLNRPASANPAPGAR